MSVTAFVAKTHTGAKIYCYITARVQVPSGHERSSQSNALLQLKLRDTKFPIVLYWSSVQAIYAVICQDIRPAEVYSSHKSAVIHYVRLSEIMLAGYRSYYRLTIGTGGNSETRRLTGRTPQLCFIYVKTY